MPQLFVITCQTHRFIWWDGFVGMPSNVNFDAKPILKPFVIANCFVCGLSTTQPNNYKNGSACEVYILSHIFKTD